MINDQPKALARRRRGCGHWLCAVLSVILTGAALALWAIETRFANASVWTYLLTYSPQVLALLPPVVLAVFCLLLGQRRWAVYNLLLTLVVANAFVRPAWPHLPSRAPTADRIRIVTWNTHSEYGRVREMSAFLASLKPDIVCLQETGTDAYLKVLPGATARRTHDVTILTRGKVLATREFPLGPQPNYRYGLDLDVQLRQGRLRVLSVHWEAVQLPFSLPRRRRESMSGYRMYQQARDNEAAVTLDWLRETPGPRVVTGDFNTPPNAPEYRALERVARNAFLTGLGFGFTFHRRLPLIRIDHVWCAGGVRPVRCVAVQNRLSDHFPVVAEVTLSEDRGD
jgi:endonuclease/exonuclease/phosphatase family metal-dependent hydrolase